MGQPCLWTRQDWSNAYKAVKLPDALSGVRQAIRVAFWRDVRAVAPTADKFNIFNGVYVNVTADVGFVNIAGHELWHIIKRQRPELIEWCQQHSRQFYKDLLAEPAFLPKSGRGIQMDGIHVWGWVQSLVTKSVTSQTQLSKPAYPAYQPNTTFQDAFQG